MSNRLTEKQIQQFNLMYEALRIIAKEYLPSEKLKGKYAERNGLSNEESIEYAYDNVQETAKRALKGIKKIAKPV